MAFPKGFLAQRLSGLKARVQHAFAVEPAGQPLSAEDIALLERVAAAVVEREMAVPAVMFLESVGPMNFLGSQALHFFTPILEVVFPQRDIERVALLLERRDTLSRLAILIERRAETRRAATRP
ncbi:MAG: hypothetical protein EPO02_02050 [Nitrospirae bacterium]|nr:MAG: hypothetical protein EPO02_02050 [Nitrospirota bacterium]